MGQLTKKYIISLFFWLLNNCISCWDFFICADKIKMFGLHWWMGIEFAFICIILGAFYMYFWSILCKKLCIKVTPYISWGHRWRLPLCPSSRNLQFRHTCRMPFTLVPLPFQKRSIKACYVIEQLAHNHSFSMQYVLELYAV